MLHPFLLSGASELWCLLSRRSDSHIFHQRKFKPLYLYMTQSVPLSHKTLIIPHNHLRTPQSNPQWRLVSTQAAAAHLFLWAVWGQSRTNCSCRCDGWSHRGSGDTVPPGRSTQTRWCWKPSSKTWFDQLLLYPLKRVVGIKLLLCLGLYRTLRKKLQAKGVMKLVKLCNSAEKQK